MEFFILFEHPPREARLPETLKAPPATTLSPSTATLMIDVIGLMDTRLAAISRWHFPFFIN
jgi:hypothetical protein